MHSVANITTIITNSASSSITSLNSAPYIFHTRFSTRFCNQLRVSKTHGICKLAQRSSPLQAIGVRALARLHTVRLSGRRRKRGSVLNYNCNLLEFSSYSIFKMGYQSSSWSLSSAASVWLLLLVAVIATLSVEAQLTTNFYKSSCPNAENVITSAVNSALNRRAAAAAGVLRIYFHDCFVHGCDGSVLIDSPSEKDARPNLSLQGFEVIDAAKTAVEKQCPGIVSCADITALASQLSVKKLSGGRITWNVPLGRRDGLVSSADDVTGKLPAPTATVPTLKSIFSAVGLSTEDMVVLSGAHSVGVASCGAIQNRLTTPSDPTLDASYAAVLKKQCPSGSTAVVNLDLTTPSRLDEKYYTNLQKQKGLLTSDQGLQGDAETKAMVAALTVVNTFNSKFAASMIKMGNIGVLTGSQGNIRLNCRQFNV